MAQSSKTLCLGLDVPEVSIAVAYAPEERGAEGLAFDHSLVPQDERPWARALRK
jgi:hypothetical protein